MDRVSVAWGMGEREEVSKKRGDGVRWGHVRLKLDLFSGVVYNIIIG